MLRLLAILVMIGTLAGTPLAQAQSNEQEDIANARARAEEIFALAGEEQFNVMYDLIHPDARAVVPRVVAVNTFRELYALAEAGRSEVIEVQMGPWTWGVTGQEYDYAAHVSFRQPYVENGEEQILEDTMYLVQDDEGEWRWFFGGTREFVDLAIETFGDEDDTALVDGDLIQNTVEDLDEFYRDAFSTSDLEYESPGVVLVEEGGGVRTACGPAETGFWAFYCPPDATVYLDEGFLNELGKQAPFAEAFVIAHEWAHHVQTLMGLERVQDGPDDWNEVYSIELELMADCMSGDWAHDVGTRGLLNPEDIDQTIAFTIEYLGDPPFIDEYDPQAHGSSDQRAEAFKGGYDDGLIACNIMI